MSRDLTGESTRTFGAPYFFSGRVLPERTHVQFNFHSLGAELADRRIEFSVLCFGSQFLGDIKSDHPFESALHAAGIAKLIIKGIVDRIGYTNICGYDVEISSISDGEYKEIIGVYESIFDHSFEDQLSFSKKNLPYPIMIPDGIQHPRLDHALRCFNHALRDSALTTLFCYLAIETIARMVCEIVTREPVDDIRKDEWAIFRRTVRVEESTIHSDVKHLADDFRHGNFVDTTWEQRKKALGLTWHVIARGMHVIKTGSALDSRTFLVL